MVEFRLPDVPYQTNPAIYNYLLQVHSMLRAMTDAINTLDSRITALETAE